MDKRTRPMARGDRRKQLLRMARELVAADGLSALTMTALSERADVAKPVVYSHFKNRHQVAIALLDEHFEALEAFARERLQKAKTFDEYLSLLVDCSFEFEESSRTPVRKITNGFSAGDEVNQAFHRHEEEYRLHWRRLLELHDVPKDVADVAAYGLVGILNNVVFNVVSMSNRRRTRETVKKLVLSAIHALVPASEASKPFDPVLNYRSILDEVGAQNTRQAKGRKGRASKTKRARAA